MRLGFAVVDAQLASGMPIEEGAGTSLLLPKRCVLTHHLEFGRKVLFQVRFILFQLLR